MTTNNLKTADHQNEEVKEIIKQLKDINLDGSYYLMILTGPYKKGKKVFIDKLASELGKKITLINTHDIVTMNEKETEQNIDSLFESITDEDQILFFMNGDRLCGAYAGYTYSSVRYATPQEKYLLKKINKLEKIVILDIVEEHNIDKTLQRYSHSKISFKRPTSFLKRLTWQLGNTDFHGHNFTSKRPV
jgi:SpoVK/Ycf46/Vps4 family AAA+-type ATPase